MPQFKYTARNTAGKTIQGTMDAAVERAVVDKLRGDRLTIMNINEVKGSAETPKDPFFHA